LAISVLSHHYPVLLQTVEMSLGQTGALLGAVVWELVWKMGGVMLVLSAADVVWQRYNFERNIRMSKQEIKDESKNSEGDPQVKARIRQLQRKAALQRMMEAIPRADVVLTNPTHLAIAIGYDRENMGAPQVLAKGANAVAERIKDKAREAQVPVMENKPLARALFRSTDVGDEIPAELYTAVSEVLIYVYRMSGKLDDYLASSPPPPPGTGPGAEE
jgi:flagellar biosynthetic protein FlhB